MSEVALVAVVIYVVGMFGWPIVHGVEAFVDMDSAKSLEKYRTASNRAAEERESARRSARLALAAPVWPVVVARLGARRAADLIAIAQPDTRAERIARLERNIAELERELDGDA